MHTLSFLLMEIDCYCLINYNYDFLLDIRIYHMSQDVQT